MTPAPEGLFQGALAAVAFAVVVLTVLAFTFALATAILRLRNERVAARWQRLEAAWEPLILDVLVGERAPAVLHEAVRPAERLYFVEYLVRFARRFRGEERALIAELGGPYLPEIAARLRHPKPEARARAVQTLGTLGLPAWAGAVRDALDDPSPLVAMTALRMLARPAHPEHAPAVLARLERFDALARRFLAALLAAIGPAAAPALRALLAEEARAERVRVVAAEALALLGDPGAGGVAAAVVWSGQGRELCAAALRLLRRVGTAAHADAARAAAASTDAVVRSHALTALGRIGDARDRTLLQDAVSGGDPWVALHAAYALAELGGADALRALGAGGGSAAPLAREVLESPAA